MTVKERLHNADKHILAALCGGRVLELNDAAEDSAALVPLTLQDDEGDASTSGRCGL